MVEEKIPIEFSDIIPLPETPDFKSVGFENYKLEIVVPINKFNRRIARGLANVAANIKPSIIEDAKEYINKHNLNLKVSQIISLSMDRCLIALTSGFVNPVFSYKDGMDAINAILLQRRMEMEATNENSLHLAHLICKSPSKFKEFLVNRDLTMQHYHIINKSESKMNHEWETIDLSYVKDDVYNMDLKRVISLTNPNKVKRLILFNCDKLDDNSVLDILKLTNLNTLSLSGCEKITGDGISILSNLKNLKELHLNRTRWSMGTLKLPNLKSLSLEGGILPDLVWPNNLESLSIRNTHIPNHKFAESLMLKSLVLNNINFFTTKLQLPDTLEYLDISNTNIQEITNLRDFKRLNILKANATKSNVAFKGLKRTGVKYLDFSDNIWIDAETLKLLPPDLEELNLSNCPMINDDALKELSSLQKLHTLDISHCKSVTDTGIIYLKNTKSLLRLFLDYCNLVGDEAFTSGFQNLREIGVIGIGGTDLCFNRICRITSLTKLSISGWVSNIEHISNLFLLEILDLIEININNSNAEAISTLSQLQEIEFIRCELTGESFHHLHMLENVTKFSVTSDRGIQNMDRLYFGGLSKMKNLQILNLDSVNIQWEDISQLQNLEKLSHLSFNESDVVDDEFNEILKIKSLEYLSIRGNHISSESFNKLPLLRNLKYINLINSRILGPFEVGQMARKHGIKIIYSHIMDKEISFFDL